MEGVFNYINSFKEAFEIQCIQLLVKAYHFSITDYKNDWQENDYNSTIREYINLMTKNQPICVGRDLPLYVQQIVKTRGFANKEPKPDFIFCKFDINTNNKYYYFAEAKRLKENNSSLQQRYIDTGIGNFISKKYPKGILIGYQVQGDIPNTINKICSMLCNSGRNDEVLIEKTFDLYEHYYESEHPNIGTLKHLIFDYTMPKGN